MVEPGLVMRAFGVASVAVCSLAACATFARPKSSSLACPRLVTKIFAGLMSRWTIPLLCAASSASAISMLKPIMVSVSSGRPMMRCFQGLSVEEFHGDEGLAVLLIDLVDGADVGMVQSRGRLRLAL